MNLIYLVLLYQFVHFSQTSDQQLWSLSRVKMGIIENGKMISHVTLKRTNRLLANEHLPVWILNGVVDSDSINNEDGDELYRDYEVMNQLGEFTTYHDPEMSSAAVYFRKRREFDGMIGYEFLIQKLSIDIIHSKKTLVLTLDQYGVYRRPNYIGHKNDRKMVDEDPEAGITYQGPMLTYENRLYDGYPEVLVIVSSDLAEEWTQNVHISEWYTTIVSRVLTLFNAVDMLYSKLKNTIININIAGIIIGTARESFRFLENCYYPETIEHYGSTYRLEGVCVTNVFRRFLSARKSKIPLDSYDMAIFLTRENLYKMMGNVADSQRKRFLRIIGIVGSTYKLYKTREQDVGFILVGTVTTNQVYENYASLAHEMAHLMTIKHDKPKFFTPDGECSGHIMKTGGKWCDKCLSWSETSEKSFFFFFSSPNCCAFTNFPRSLNPPGRRKILSADMQCQCYGYKSAKKFCDFRDILWGFCKIELRCEESSNKFLPTVIPMDGTPCGNKKVCWDRKCEAIETFKYPHHQNKDNPWKFDVFELIEKLFE